MLERYWNRILKMYNVPMQSDDEVEIRRNSTPWY